MNFNSYPFHLLEHITLGRLLKSEGCVDDPNYHSGGAVTSFKWKWKQAWTLHCIQKVSLSQRHTHTHKNQYRAIRNKLNFLHLDYWSVMKQMGHHSWKLQNDLFSSPLWILRGGGGGRQRQQECMEGRLMDWGRRPLFHFLWRAVHRMTELQGAVRKVRISELLPRLVGRTHIYVPHQIICVSSIDNVVPDLTCFFLYHSMQPLILLSYTISKQR